MEKESIWLSTIERITREEQPHRQIEKRLQKGAYIENCVWPSNSWFSLISVSFSLYNLGEHISNDEQKAGLTSTLTRFVPITVTTLNCHAPLLLDLWAENSWELQEKMQEARERCITQYFRVLSADPQWFYFISIYRYV